MVHLELLNKNNQSLMASSRPVRSSNSLGQSSTREQTSLTYNPPLVQALHCLISPKVLLGFSTLRQTLSVPLATRQILQTSRSSRVHSVLVEVGRKDVYLDASTAHEKEVQIYRSKLHLKAHFTGLRYILYHYKYTSFLLLTTSFFLAEVFSALTFWFAFVYFRSRKADERLRKSPPLPQVKVTDAKPTREELLRHLRAADEAEAVEFRELQATMRPTMDSEPSVLAPLKQDEVVSGSEEDVSSEGSADSWQQTTQVAEVDVKDEPDDASIGGVRLDQISLLFLIPWAVHDDSRFRFDVWYFSHSGRHLDQLDRFVAALVFSLSVSLYAAFCNIDALDDESALTR